MLKDTTAKYNAKDADSERTNIATRRANKQRRSENRDSVCDDARKKSRIVNNDGTTAQSNAHRELPHPRHSHFRVGGQVRYLRSVRRVVMKCVRPARERGLIERAGVHRERRGRRRERDNDAEEQEEKVPASTVSDRGNRSQPSPWSAHAYSTGHVRAAATERRGAREANDGRTEDTSTRT